MPRHTSLSSLVMVLLVGGLLVPASPASAAVTYVVNSTADDTDPEGCQPTPGDCTLREAILAANAGIGPGRVTFALGGGVPTINIASELPPIEDRLLLNGATGGATRVELTGPFGSDCDDGLAIAGSGASGSVIKKMVLNGFHCVGIRIDSSNENVVIGNWIGTDETGMAPGGGMITGILIAFGSSSNIIGGTTAVTRNVIGDNDSGVVVGTPGSSNTIIGNLIGIGVGGVPVPNGTGVRVEGTGVGNTIQGNRIDHNSSLGIDLGDGGVTPNDSVDEDTGANDLQNFPEILEADASATETSISGELSSTPNSTFRIDLYSSPSCDTSGFGEGAIPLANFTGSTDAAGSMTFDITTAPITVGRVVTGTATNAGGSTSEFSECRAVI